SAAATLRPIEVLPAPIKPTSTTQRLPSLSRRAARPCCNSGACCWVIVAYPHEKACCVKQRCHLHALEMAATPPHKETNAGRRERTSENSCRHSSASLSRSPFWPASFTAPWWHW